MVKSGSEDAIQVSTSTKRVKKKRYRKLSMNQVLNEIKEPDQPLDPYQMKVKLVKRLLRKSHKNFEEEEEKNSTKSLANKTSPKNRINLNNLQLEYDEEKNFKSQVKVKYFFI